MNYNSVARSTLCDINPFEPRPPCSTASARLSTPRAMSVDAPRTDNAHRDASVDSCVSRGVAGWSVVFHAVQANHHGCGWIHRACSPAVLFDGSAHHRIRWSQSTQRAEERVRSTSGIARGEQQKFFSPFVLVICRTSHFAFLAVKRPLACVCCYTQRRDATRPRAAESDHIHGAVPSTDHPVPLHMFVVAYCNTVIHYYL